MKRRDRLAPEPDSSDAKREGICMPINQALALPIEKPFSTTLFGSILKRFEAAATVSNTSASPAQLKALFIRPKGSSPNWPSSGDQPGVLPALDGQLAVA